MPKKAIKKNEIGQGDIFGWDAVFVVEMHLNLYAFLYQSLHLLWQSTRCSHLTFIIRLFWVVVEGGGISRFGIRIRDRDHFRDILNPSDVRQNFTKNAPGIFYPLNVQNPPPLGCPKMAE